MNENRQFQGSYVGGDNATNDIDDNIAKINDNDTNICGAHQEDGTICMETNTLAIIDEFNQIFQDKINDIDRNHGDNIELKYPIYRSWVNELINQVKELVDTVEKLEHEACKRLQMLEKKLETSKESELHAVNRYFNDLKNVLEVLRRARDERRWSADGLEFLTDTAFEFFRSPSSTYKEQNWANNNEEHDDLNAGDQIVSVNFELTPPPTYSMEFQLNELELERKKVQQLERQLETQAKQIEKLTMQDNIQNEINHSQCLEDFHMANNHFVDVSKDLKSKERQLQSVKTDNSILSSKLTESEISLYRRDQEIAALKKASIDTRALVLEVAEKHDICVKYRNEITALEDQLKRKDVHIHFKDEIIRELRRECKKSNKNSFTNDNSNTTNGATNSIASMENVDQNELAAIYHKNHNHQQQNEQPTIPTIKNTLKVATDKENESLKILQKEIDDLIIQIGIKEEQIAKQQQIIDLYEKGFKGFNKVVHTDDALILKTFLIAMNRAKQSELSPPPSNPDINATSDFTSGIFSDAILSVSSEPTTIIRNVNNDNIDDSNCSVDDGSITTTLIASDSDQNYCDDFGNDKNDTAGIDVDSKAVKGIEEIMRAMINSFMMLKEENNELKTTLANISDRVKSSGDASSDIYTLADVCEANNSNIVNFRQFNKLNGIPMDHKFSIGRVLIDIATDFSKILNKQLSDDEIQALTNGNSTPFSNLMQQLQIEIQCKDRLLNDKNEIISNLKETAKQCEMELYDCKKRSTTVSKERDRNIATINELKEAISLHLDTNSRLQASKTKLEEDLNDLKQMLAAQETSDKCQLEKYRKLENEEHQYQGGNGFLSKVLTNLEVCLLNEQLNESFAENMKQEKMIQQLREDNLNLRGEIYFWSQDYQFLEEKYLKKSINEDNSKNLKQNVDKWNSLPQQSDSHQTIITNFEYYNKNYATNQEKLLITNDMLHQQPASDKLLKMEQQQQQHNCQYEQKLSSDNKLLEELFVQMKELAQQCIDNKKFVDDSAGIIECVDRLEIQNDKLKLIVEQNETKLLNYESELDQLKLQNQSLLSEVNQNQIHINEMTITNDKLKQELASMVDHRQNDVTTGMQVKQLESQLKQKTIEQHRLRRSNSEDRRKLTNENNELSNTNRELETKISKLQGFLDKKTKEINQLKNRLDESRQIETELKSELNQRTDTICSLNEEKSNVCQQNSELSSKLINTQTEFNLFECKLLNQLSHLQKINDDRLMMIKSNEQDIISYSKQNELLTKDNIQLNTEIKKYHKEICHLRECIARADGQENVLNEMLKGTQNELIGIKEEMQNLTVILTEADHELNETKKANIWLNQQCEEQAEDYLKVNTKFNEYRHNYETLQSEHDKLLTDYRNLLSIKEKAVNALETATIWQKDQKERDQIINVKLAKQNEHIQTLLDERQNLLKKIHEMHRDLLILRGQYDQNQQPEHDIETMVRNSFKQSTLFRNHSDPALDQSDDLTINHVKTTTKKLHRTVKFWQDGLRF